MKTQFPNWAIGSVLFVTLLTNVSGAGVTETDHKSNEPILVQSATSDTPTINRDILTIYDSQARPSDRLKAVHSLGDDLNRHEIVLLYNFLTAAPGKNESNLAGLRYVKNEVFGALREQKAPPSDLIDVSIAIYRDHKQDFVTRDYAVQSLSDWFTDVPTTPEQERNIYNAMVEAAHDGTSIAGTAIVNLDRIFEEATPQRKSEIDRLALEIATSREADATARSSAIQVCADRGVKQVLPVAEQLAQTPGPTALRLSAIAAIGRLGSPNAETILRKLEAEQNENLKPAIESARRTLQYKFSKIASF